MSAPGTRRDLLAQLWRGAGVALGAAFAAVLARALGTRTPAGETVLSADAVARALAEGGGVVSDLWISGTPQSPEATRLACTHLGCRVEAVPGGFACPCHRSRYDAVGRPVAGPARRPLSHLALERRGASWIARS